MTIPRAESGPAAVVPRLAALFLLVFGLNPLANELTGGEAVRWFRHSLTFWIVIGGLLLVVLYGLARLLPAVVDRVWDGGTAAVMSIPPALFVTVVAVLAFAGAATLAVVCFGRQPHNADEVAQLFHAKILLSGRLSLPPDPNPEFFGMDNMIEKGRWYSQFPIGAVAFLAIGLLFHAAWLLDPALLGLTAFSLYGFTRRAYGEPVARATLLLMVFSPFALFMSASFMNHVPVLWLVSIAMWQLTIWADADDRQAATRAAALIGLSLGVAFTVRPLDALVVGAVIGAMQLAQLRGDAGRLKSIGAEIAAGLVPVAILFYANAVTNGAPLRLGYEVLYGNAHQLGFHLDPYGTMHTPGRAVLFASKYLLQLNVLLYEWPLPAVGIIAAGLLALRRPCRWDFLLIALFIGQVVAYALYWHDGAFRGPRFLFTALPAILILTARTPFLLGEVTTGVVRRMTTLAFPACVLFAWLAFGIGDSVPGQIRQYRHSSPVSRVDAAEVTRAAGIHNALVFINEGREARNLHYLWALGLSRGDAARLMVSASACGVRQAIAREESMQPRENLGRRDRLIRSAMAFDTVVDLPPICATDVRQDDEGSASFAPFFPANGIGPDGHVAGDVIYVLDLGAHDEVLRSRFGSRSWYRFGPRRDPSDTTLRIIPYQGTPTQ